MVALLISVLVSLGTLTSGTSTSTKGTTTTTTTTTTTPAATVLGGTSTWTNGGVE